MEKKRVKNTKKQIVAKLAGVTMMATIGWGVAAPLSGATPAIVGMAEGVQVESLTGSIDVSKQTTTAKLVNQVGNNTPGETQSTKNYITQWVVEGEKEFIKPSVISSEDIEKEKAGFSPAGTIEGYKFVRTDTNTNTNTQTHVFRKIKAEPVKELKTISKDENGLVIKTEKGSGSPTDLSGYKFLEETTDKDGNKVRTYHKIVTKAVATVNGKEVVLNVKDGIVPTEKIDGYSFSERKVDPKTGDVIYLFKKDGDNLNNRTNTANSNSGASAAGSNNETDVPNSNNGTSKESSNSGTGSENKPLKIVTKSKATIDGKEVTLLVQDGLDSNPASIPGFAYSETKTDPETGDLIYYYTDRTPNIGGKLAVYKDEQGNVFLTAKGEIPEVDEKLYKLLKTETDEDGNQVFTYHRIVTNYTTVIDGKEDIIKTNLGETPKEEIPGYKFDKTEKDDKTGDLKQVYTKDLKTADKKEAVKTGASASKIILPIIGLAGLGGLVGFIAKRKSKK